MGRIPKLYQSNSGNNLTTEMQRILSRLLEYEERNSEKEERLALAGMADLQLVYYWMSNPMKELFNTDGILDIQMLIETKYCNMYFDMTF